MWTKNIALFAENSFIQRFFFNKFSLSAQLNLLPHKVVVNTMNSMVCLLSLALNVMSQLLHTVSIKSSILLFFLLLFGVNILFLVKPNVIRFIRILGHVGILFLVADNVLLMQRT